MRTMSSWKYACWCSVCDGVPRRSLYVALIVGTILNLINQGDAFIGMAPVNWLKVMLTYCVPYAGYVRCGFVPNATAPLRKRYYGIVTGSRNREGKAVAAHRSTLATVSGTYSKTMKGVSSSWRPSNLLRGLTPYYGTGVRVFPIACRSFVRRG